MLIGIDAFISTGSQKTILLSGVLAERSNKVIGNAALVKSSSLDQPQKINFPPILSTTGSPRLL
jgi:hypothetical protein